MERRKTFAARHAALTGFLALALAPALGGCGLLKSSEPEFTYMPDMAYSPAFKAQEGQMRVPPKGTIPVNHDPYDFAADEEGSKTARNPLPRTKAVLERGQAMYNTYCIVCHGAYGEGDGTIVPKYPRPPSLQTEKIRQYPDGRIFHVITMGQNLMPSYAPQIKAVDRWAIIHYVRAIQRAKNPTTADLQAAEQAAGN
jgi:mono/diheme cytochrome c family protein